jgi:predicted permease
MENININVFLVSEQTIILFIIAIAGIYARKTKIIDAASTGAMSRLLLNVTQPLMIITSFQMDFDPEKLANGFTVFATSVILHVSTAVLVFFIYMPFRKNRGDKKIYEICSIFNNCAFLGYPVLKVVFGGELGIFYGSFYAAFFNMFIWTYGVYILTKEDKGKKTNAPKPSVISGAAKIFLNAGFIASVLGLVLFVLRVRFPPVVYQSAKLVGDMTFPLSMLIIGSLISDLDFKGLFLSAKNYYYIIIKLFGLPLLTAVILRALGADTYLIYVAAVMASMPAGAHTAIFAENYNANSALASKLVGLSTLFSIATIPFILYILGVMGV